MKENLYCLLSDQTVEIVDPLKIPKYISTHQVEYILIPVGVYSNEYCLVTPNVLPFEIDKISFEYQLCLQEFTEEDAIYEKIYDNSTVVKTKKSGMVGIYKMVHSIYNINGINAVINTEMYDEFTSFVFDYFKVSVKSGNNISVQDSRDVSMIEACPYTSNYITIDSRAPYVLFCIDHAMGRNTKNKESIIPPISTNKFICIDTLRSEWIESDSLKRIMKNSDNSDSNDDNILVSMPGVNFNSLMFMKPDDIRILNEFDHYTFGYLMIQCSQLDFDDSDIMSSESIGDLYDNRLFDSGVAFIDSSIGLYELSSVGEILNHFKYIFKTIQLINEKVYGVCDRIIIYVGFSTCNPKRKTRDFIYAITNEDVEDDYCCRDFFSEFIDTAREYLESTPKKKHNDYEGWSYD